jgi:hypothetical protein
MNRIDTHHQNLTLSFVTNDSVKKEIILTPPDFKVGEMSIIFDTGNSSITIIGEQFLNYLLQKVDKTQDDLQINTMLIPIVSQGIGGSASNNEWINLNLKFNDYMPYSNRKEYILHPLIERDKESALYNSILLGHYDLYKMFEDGFCIGYDHTIEKYNDEKKELNKCIEYLTLDPSNLDPTKIPKNLITDMKIIERFKADYTRFKTNAFENALVSSKINISQEVNENYPTFNNTQKKLLQFCLNIIDLLDCVYEINSKIYYESNIMKIIEKTDILTKIMEFYTILQQNNSQEYIDIINSFEIELKKKKGIIS